LANRSTPRRRRIEPARRILNYFMRNREAADTYEGIVRWRLREESIHQITEETEQALGWLVSRGYLREEQRATGPSVFRLDPSKQAEAQAFLDEDSEAPEGK
jgi:hypothetical protein